MTFVTKFNSNDAKRARRPAPVRFPKLKPHRILVCRPNVRLGNTLLLTPLIQEIESIWPGAEIDVLSACDAAPEIFREFSCVRNIHKLPRHGARHPLQFLRGLLRARSTYYDLVIDPCPRSKSARFITRLMRATT